MAFRLHNKSVPLRALASLVRRVWVAGFSLGRLAVGVAWLQEGEQ